MGQPLDMPDDYPYLPGSTRSPLADLGELAARLGSVVLYDRRGEVLWWDDVRYGLNVWTHTSSGTGGGVSVQTGGALMSDDTLKLTAGSDGGVLAQITKYFAPATLGKAGVEHAVAFISEFTALLIYLSRFDGTNWHRGRIKLDRISSEIQYELVAGGYQKIDDLPNVVNSQPIYQFVKLVVDFEEDEYVRLMYNQNEYSLAGIAIPTVANADPPQHRIDTQFQGRAGNNDVCYIGRTILTGNEP